MQMGGIVCSEFEAPWWLRNRHLQTILPNSPLRPRPALSLRNEVLELPDGDFLRLEWLDGPGPIVILLHGLEGSSRSRYACGIMAALGRAGCCVVLMSFRGCGGVPNRLARSYHAGETADLDHVVGTLHERYPERLVAALGYSLGGNALLKYLGERGPDAGLRTAVAVSVPFDLQDSAAAMRTGAARLYQRLLLGHLKDSTRRKFAIRTSPFDLGPGLTAPDFEGFDEHVTAPLHGFADAPHYYLRCSSRSFLREIRVPTLILHAADDPFMTRASIPGARELAPSVRLELSSHGGHVGFVTGSAPWNLSCWLEGRIVRHFAESLLDASAPQAPAPRLQRSWPWRRKPRARGAAPIGAAGDQKLRS